MAESTKYAFPHEINDNSKVVHFGMTLRDYFAAKAMQGICSNNKYDAIADEVAVAAYEHADAMLRARETKEAK